MANGCRYLSPAFAGPTNIKSGKMRETPEPLPLLSADQIALIESLSASEVRMIDEELFANTNEHWQKVAMVVGKTMSELTNRSQGIPDLYYAQRVRNLVEQDLLESQGNLAFIRFSEVRRVQHRA
jgi:Protein of unknown function